MTTELQEPKAPIRVDVLQKQYRNGMKLAHLARLYEVEEAVLKPYLEGIEPKKRNTDITEMKPTDFSKEDIEEILDTHSSAYTFKVFTGIASDQQMYEILDRHGLRHRLKTREQEKVELYERIIKELDNGRDRQSLRAVLKISKWTVDQAIEHFGRDDLKQKQVKLTREKKDALAEGIRSRVATMSRQEIIQELDIKLSVYDTIRREYNIPPAKRKVNTAWKNTLYKQKEHKRMTQPKPDKHDYLELAGRIRDLFAQGRTTNEVIQETEISRATYYRIKEDHGHEWDVVDGRKERHKQTSDKTTVRRAVKQAPADPPMHPRIKENHDAIERALGAVKPEEKAEVIGIKRTPVTDHETRVMNRDKAVWGEYLTARSEDIADVSHGVEVVVENGKLIERTVIQYTLERELAK